MGMFDYIRCKVPLPDGWLPHEPLQTKDFDCDMVCHEISPQGRLLLQRVDSVHEVPKAERPYPNDDGMLGLCGSIHREKSVRDSNFHGILNFYGSDQQKNWHEYNAKFTDGQLVSIEVVPD
jgi:hypothetical protein